jgi:NitT/TauT family transport system permease protein
MTKFTALSRQYWPTLVLFAFLLASWQAAVSFGGIREYLLPAPLSVWNALWHGDTQWAQHLWATTLEIIGAFVMANALVPFLVFVNTLPKVAVAPLFLIWMGYGIFPNMLMGALIGFFPVVINTAVGLSQVEADMLDLGRVFNAPKWKIFAKIRLPNALPYILSALKITATAAVVGAIVGEFVASQKGLGYVIVATQSSMNTSVAFAALVWISAVGLVLYGAVVLLAHLWAPWAEGVD